jgi:glycosyltransferase involved in cell wall biosynthesis
MATKNSDQFLQSALQSIRRQTVGPVRTIIVDKESSDGTRDIAESFDFVELIAQRSDGYQMAWNEGLGMASTPFVALLDSDDTYLPTALESGYAVLASHIDSDAALGRVEFFSDDAQPLRNARQNLFGTDSNAAIPGAFVFRRSLFGKVGYFGTEYKILSDVEWILRLSARGVSVCNHDSVVLRKRVHSQSLGARAASTTLYQQEFLHLVRRHAQSRGFGTKSVGN